MKPVLVIKEVADSEGSSVQPKPPIITNLHSRDTKNCDPSSNVRADKYPIPASFEYRTNSKRHSRH